MPAGQHIQYIGGPDEFSVLLGECGGCLGGDIDRWRAEEALGIAEGWDRN